MRSASLPGTRPAGRALAAEELAALVREAQAGDRGAFERLVIETSPDCYALALRLVGNEHDAADVLQETYLRAFRSLDRFRGEAAVTTWLYRITANCAATLCRRRGRGRSMELSGGLGPAVPAEGAEGERWVRLPRDEAGDGEGESEPERAAGAADERARLVEALRRLPPALRLVVVLHDVYDLSHADISEELGISRTAAKVRLHRARRRLRDELFPLAPGRRR